MEKDLIIKRKDGGELSADSEWEENANIDEDLKVCRKKHVVAIKKKYPKD